MVGLGFGGALHGFERRVWSVTLYIFLFFFFLFFVSVFLLFCFLSFFYLMSTDAKEHNY